MPGKCKAQTERDRDIDQIKAVLCESHALMYGVCDRLHDPVAGFGTMRMFSDMAAPIPVRTMAMPRMITRTASPPTVLSSSE